MVNHELDLKLESLRTILAEIGGCVVGFSGGVDSTFLLAVATDVLGDRVLAVTAGSDIHPDFEQREAAELAAKIGARHLSISKSLLAVDKVRENPTDRCYHCKREIFGELHAVAEKEGLPYVVEGTNVSDGNVYRPGRKALAELEIRSPLLEAGLTKTEIRELSRSLGLPTWNKPALPCLATRVPYGTALSPEIIGKVGKAEAGLRELGFEVLRVRHHGDVARLELGPTEFVAASRTQREEVTRIVEAAGYAYVSLDLGGYRSGALDEVIGEASRQG